MSAAYQNRGTSTGAGLNRVRSDILTSGAGYRGGQAVVVVITDGATQEPADVLQMAVDAMQLVAEVFVIGVGNELITTELSLIGSRPSCQYVF